jgi:hypothetical protein
MNSLRFESPLGLTLAILLAVVGLTIVIRGYTRGLTFQTKAVRRWMVLAMVAKCAAVLGLAVMVANPQREIRRPKPGENLVLVAIDGSSSLNLVDAGPSRTGGKSLTRGEALKQRLIGRGTETPEIMARRLVTAEAELAAQGEFDVVVVNSQLDSACSELVTLLVGNTPQSA